MSAPSGPKHKSGGRIKKKSSWASKERAGMSFILVLAFFAVFGIIILTEVFVMDDRPHSGGGGGSASRPSGYGSRWGESVPDYEEVQDDYADFVLRDKRLHSKSRESFKSRADSKSLESLVLNNNKNNKLNSNTLGGRSATRTGGSSGGDPKKQLNTLPWGHVLSTSLEEQLPRYANIVATAGAPKDAVWQTVKGTRFKFFVYSAFYDRRNSRIIRVVGATKTRNPERVWCRLFYPKANNETDHTVTVLGRVKIIRENWNLKYSACFVLCPLKDQSKVLTPYAVSIVARLRMPPKNLLLVQKTDHDPGLELLFNNSVSNGFTNASTLFAWNENRNTKEFLSAVPERIGMCVKPLHFNYDQALYLMEFLELNSILGITHATFYNHTIGPKANCILNKYMDGSRERILKRAITESVMPMTISVMPWDLNMESQKEIRTEGLFAALNDCLYRSMYSYGHVMFMDLDEYVLPRQNRTITELIQFLSKPLYRQNSGAFSFQNAFFYLQFPDDSLILESTDALQRALLTQRKTQRRKKLHPQKQRSKYICKPEAVIEAGNHFIWEFMAGKGHLNVPPDVAILHHYRVCEFGGEDCIKAASVQDRTAHKYGGELTARIRALYTNLKTKCNLPKLPAPPKAKRTSGGVSSAESASAKKPDNST